MAGLMTRLGLVPVAVAAFSACLAMALWVADSGAKPAKRVTASTIGATTSSPRPNCPTPNIDNPPADEACQAMARVTGFQVDADGRHNPFKVREPGTIVAWGLDVSKPDKSEREFFATAIDKSGPPSARISVLKPKEGGYKLLRQSAVVQLDSVLGTKPTFTLTDPLRIKKGMFVALTAPTWVSNLADAGASASDTWLTSRESGQCGTEAGDSAAENEADLKERSRPHQKVGGIRTYACEYRGARILYWAYYVPKR
jgi:hypothetical protein